MTTGERIPTSALKTQSEDLTAFTTRPLGDDLSWVYEALKTPALLPAVWINDVLTPDALAMLDSLPIPTNGKCSNEALMSHPVASALARTMGQISLMNRYYDYDPDKVVTSLRNESGNDIVIRPHRDLLDGHAVLYNWGVEGDLNYTIDGEEYSIDSNEILVLNGAANWQEVTAAIPGEKPPDIFRFGGTTAVHSVIGRGPTSRNRLLVYADGQETEFTQIFVDEYGPAPSVQGNLLFQGLRPSLGFYVE